jgi:cytochrome b subunit of formate dehydrogenase
MRSRGTQPVLGYPSYIEKIEYWAFIRGTVIIGVTALMLWFENVTLRLFLLWIMNVLTLIHYYEAVLATLAILVWHIYFVVLDPTIYPLKSRKPGST